MVEPQVPSESEADLSEMMAGHGPCTYLLLALLGLILLFPYLQEGIVGRTTLGILFSAVLLIGSFATRQTRRSFIIKLILALGSVAFQWAALMTGDIALFEVTAAAYAVSLAAAIASVFTYLLKRGPITADKLHGALAGYIMLAVLFAFIYALMEEMNAGSFGPGTFDFAQPGTFFEIIYFSLTTLTTTGYGDIVPMTNQARSIVMVEEFIGMFYVGVLIARLAGLYPPTSPRAPTR